MPHLPLIQQLYLGGVLTAFATFMAVVAYGYIQANRRPAQPERGWRSTAAGQIAERRPVGEAQPARAFQLDRA